MLLAISAQKAGTPASIYHNVKDVLNTEELKSSDGMPAICGYIHTASL